MSLIMNLLTVTGDHLSVHVVLSRACSFNGEIWAGYAEEKGFFPSPSPTGAIQHGSTCTRSWH